MLTLEQALAWMTFIGKDRPNVDYVHPPRHRDPGAIPQVDWAVGAQADAGRFPPHENPASQEAGFSQVGTARRQRLPIADSG